MVVVGIILATIVLVVFGRILFGQWFNHFSLYAGIWGFALALFEMRLLNYYPLEELTWTVIFAGSAAFFLGAATISAYRFGRRASQTPSYPRLKDTETQRLLVRMLWVLNVITLLTVLQHWYVMSRIAGGVFRVIVMANVLYSFRLEYGIPGGIPYLKSLALFSALLGGVHTATSGRVRLVAVLPLVIIFLGEVVAVGRSMLIMGTIFFLCGYFFTRGRAAARVAHAGGSKVRRLLALALVVAIILVGMDFIRTSRGSNESLSAATGSMQKLNGIAIFTPTVYLYLTGNFGVLNQYLKQDVEHVPWGGNTFLPFYRVLNRLGSNIDIQRYQRYYRTPQGVNTGTYLREVHADFGIPGVLLYPYLLGLFTSISWFALQSRFRYTILVFLGFCFANIAMAVFYGLTRAGELLIATGVGLVLARMLDRVAEAENPIIERPI